MVGAILVGVAGVAACVVFWPDTLAVNAPVWHMVFGGGVEIAEDAALSRLRAPAGFALRRFAADLENARFLRVVAAGVLVSQPRSGRVVLLEPDRDGDGRSDGRREVLSGLNRPHGLDLYGGWLYVGETDAVGRVRFDAGGGHTSGGFERVVTALPGGGNHWTRTIRFGPDGWLYLSVGSSCNVCWEKDRRRASILRYRPDGSGEELFATGLRNAVGFDWRPADGQLDATDNGRDLLGDDFPPCELNQVVAGAFYGWPIANGDRIVDPDLGRGQEARVAASIAPVHGFRAHNAPLGITFLRSERVPEPYRGAALVALHGSWNRTRKDGYKVVSLHWRPDGRIEERDFLTGFLRPEDEDVIGRPVDVAEDDAGAIYVSDDHAGSVYRLVPRAATASRQGAVGESAIPAGTAGPDAATAEVAGRAAALWRRHACVACHDPAAAEPGMVPRPLGHLSRRYTAESLAAYLRTPNPPMPAADMSDAERLDLSRYLLWRYP